MHHMTTHASNGPFEQSWELARGLPASPAQFHGKGVLGKDGAGVRSGRESSRVQAMLKSPEGKEETRAGGGGEPMAPGKNVP